MGFDGTTAPAPVVDRTYYYALGAAAERYLAPAAGGDDFSRALYGLTGAPKVPGPPTVRLWLRETTSDPHRNLTSRVSLRD